MTHHDANFTATRFETKSGSLANLTLVEGVNIGPTPQSGTTSEIHFCTVAVKFCGLNFADMFACLGLYSATPEGTFVPGLEFSGVVCGVSEGAMQQGFNLGDEVFGVTRFGGYTTCLHCDTRYIHHLPKGYSLEQGAALPAQALTAWYGLVELGQMRNATSGLPQGTKTALIHSGAGGTGLWAIKLCQYFGVNVITTVGSASKKALLQAATGLPPQCIIDRSETQTKNHRRVAVKTALNFLGRVSYDFVFDSLLGDWFDVSYEFLGVQGKHLVLGAGSMTPHSDSVNWLSLGLQYLRRPMLDPLAMISQNKSLMAFNLIWLFDNTDEVRLYLQRLLEVLPHLTTPGMETVAKGTTRAKVPPSHRKEEELNERGSFSHVGKTWPIFTDLPAALREFQSGTTVGKIVVSTNMVK